jgi:GNAT superfamily N-acetyltransferase
MAGWQDDAIVAGPGAKQPWESDPITQVKQPRKAEGVLDALQAGYQGSATGLAVRRQLPDVVLDPSHAKWYEKLAAGASQMGAELPEMVVGGVGGAAAGTAVAGPVGGIVGGGAGAFAVPTAIRESLMQAYSKGDVKGAGDFLNRAAIVLKATAKDALVGGATMGAGGLASRTVGKAIAPAIGETVGTGTARAAITGAQTTAELGTMVVTPALLDGKLPEPEDFANAAILLAGVHGAGRVASRIRSIYAKTGVPPEQVVADAKADPSIVTDLTRETATMKNGQTFSIEMSKEGPAREADRQEVFNINTPPKEGDFTLFAKNEKGEIIGHLDLQVEKGSMEAVPRDVQVHDSYKRQGVASALYEQAARMGYDVKESDLQTAAGKALRESLSKRQGQDRFARPLEDDPFSLDFTKVPSAYKMEAQAETGRSIVPGVKAADVAHSPFAEVPQAPGEPSRPTHINYDRVNTTDDVKAAMARLSEVYEADIQTQRRGTVSWEETSHEAGRILADTLGGVDTKLIMPREPGTPAGAAEILARKQLTIGAAEDMASKARDFLQKGTNASAEDAAAFLASIERAALIQSEFLGARAEAGRALNILKETRQTAERAQQIQDVLKSYGKSPVELAKMLKEIDNPAGAMKFAEKMTKAGTWEKIVEAWKAGLVSGIVTQQANIIGNTTMMAVRPVVDFAASAAGLLRSSPDRVTLAEPFARIMGDIHGTLDGLKVAGAVLRHGDIGLKSEQFRKAIPGKTGEVVRLPFRILSAQDALFRTMNERGEAWAQAARKASSEGLTIGTREWNERAAHWAQNPDTKMQAAISAAGDRMTFNTPLGEKGQAAQQFIRAWHLEWVAPFVRTPGNILKELVRMTPTAPLVKEWRQSIEKGGAEADKAVAEVIVGSSIASAVMSLAFAGKISGAGDPDPEKKRVKIAAGWQPYSVKIGDKWYSYQRLQPIGTLFGLAADTAEVWNHTNDTESDKVPKMLSIAFANSVTNQTFLQGLTNMVGVMSEPDRKGPRFFQSLAGSVVPGALSQSAQVQDPFQREINTMLDAIKNRVPGLRQSLLPARDPFGEPIANKERAWFASPITATKETEDKVRAEAARLNLAVDKAPKSVQLPAGRDRKLGEVKLTPEQRDVFADVAGHTAYLAMEPLVNSATWDSMPDMVKKRAFDVAFERARKMGRAEALPLDQRQKEAERIAEEIARRLGQ